MKKCAHRQLFTAFCLLLSVISLSGCDFLRKLAGKPTSHQIEVASMVIEARKQAHQDSLEQARILDEMAASANPAIDTIAVMDSLSMQPRTFRRSSMKERFQSPLEHFCYVVIGSFSVRDNAAKLASTAGAAGYKAVLVEMRNKMVTVALVVDGCASEILSQCEKIRGEAFAPNDAWLLIND